MEEVKKVPKKSNQKSPVFETYAEDMMNYIENDKEGVVQKIIHEQEAKEDEAINQSVKSPVNKFFLFVSMLLLCATLGLVGYYYFFYKQTLTTDTTPPFKSLVINDNTVFLEVKGDKKEAIAEKITEERRITKIKPGQLEGVYFTEDKKVIGWQRWSTLVKSNFLQDKVPVVNENFLLGIMSFEVKADPVPESAIPTDVNVLNANSSEADPVPVLQQTEDLKPAIDPLRYQPEKPARKDVFILLGIKSFGDAFPVMRSWESKIFVNLREVFDIKPNSETEKLLTKDWQDGVAQNKNARILYDKEGNIVLMYVYVDDTHAVITTTEDAVREVIERLAASMVSK